MYRSSEEHVFQRVDRIRQRVLRLLQGHAAPRPEPITTDAERTAADSSVVELRLPRLIALFQLPSLAEDVVACLIAVEFDTQLRELMRQVQRERGRPWLEIGTIAELLGLRLPEMPALMQLFSPQGVLRRSALVVLDDSLGETPWAATRVRLATRVVRHLVGDDVLPSGMELSPVGGGPVDPGSPAPTLERSLVPQTVARGAVGRARRALLVGEPLVIELVGAPGVGKRFFARALAGELGLPLLLVDMAGIDAEHVEERLADARREARITNAVICLVHWDATLRGGARLADDTAPSGNLPARLPAPIARFLDENRQLLLVTAEEREALLERSNAALAHVAIPFPTPSQRATLLEGLLRQHGVEPVAAIGASVARRFALAPGAIHVAARAAADAARAREEETLDGTVPADAEERATAEIVDACRHQLRHELRSLAIRVTDAHKWEDLVIPVDVYHSLQEMVSYIRHAPRVYDQWGFAARHSLSMGVSSLFAGPPGTGKTMCASVMARELDMELFRVDLSRVVSKWIGETEKNLGKVFDEAQRSNAIILFDEADSLFAKRTDVKSSVDRYANLEVNFLLQRMEAFGGVTILTTNFEDTLDTAFKRRLTFRMRFEKPDAPARAALWRKVFPSSALLADDIDPDRLGELYEMSGGNIRNAAVRAAFLSAAEDRPIDMATCMVAAERESREMGLLTPTTTT